MPDEKLLALLEDRHLLLQAAAASSAYVMRRAFEATRELQVFKGRADLAPDILERLHGLAGKSDPVIIGAHLYALELTGARRELAKGVLALLEDKAFRQDPLAGQFAANIGARLVRKDERLTPAQPLAPGELEELLKALEREGGQP